jgi:hypothetical protein
MELPYCFAMKVNSLACLKAKHASDELGDTNKDRVLTQARAKVVRDHLVQKYKFDDTRLKIIGLGKSAKDDAESKVAILVYD